MHAAVHIVDVTSRERKSKEQHLREVAGRLKVGCRII